MSEHGNRSARHEADIRHNIDAKHAEYNIEEKQRHLETERFQEKSSNENAAEKPFRAPEK